MAEKNKPEGDAGVVTMCITMGLWVIGKLVGGNKLVSPRVFDLYEELVFDKNQQPITDPKTGKQKTEPRIRMQPLPGLPPYCTVGPEAVKYPVLTNFGNVLDLYVRVSAQPPTPEREKEIDESRIVLPGRGNKGPMLPPGMEQN